MSAMTYAQTIHWLTFIDTKDENQKNETGKKIRSLESRIRTLKPEIKKLSIEMRNEEIKSFP